jgi:hypothetical protein
MDQKVSARFFRVSAKPDHASDFPELLLAAVKEDRAKREREVGGGLLLRIERCIDDGEFVEGDLCRKQTLNLPPEVGPDGLAPTILPEGKGHGHLAAFIYHRPTRVILLQHNVMCATPTTLGVYLMALNAACQFTFPPVLRKDALDRFKDRKPRALTLRVAAPQNLEALDDKKLSSIRGAKLLAEAFNGMYLTITVDVGRSTKKFLNAEKVNEAVTGLLDSEVDVKQLRVKTNIGDDDDQGIDFLKEHLKCSQTFDLPTDIEQHYAVRKAYLRGEFGKKKDYLNKLYGPKP